MQRQINYKTMRRVGSHALELAGVAHPSDGDPS